MKKYQNVSPQIISWVKSNEDEFTRNNAIIKNLFYPETIDELVDLVQTLIYTKQDYLIIGFSSNTLFLPTFKSNNVICTRLLNKWYEDDGYIQCECGVPVSLLAKRMLKKGYVGFEGLTDLPGTLGAAIYGNCGCRNCLVSDLVKDFVLLKPDGSLTTLSVNDLRMKYRSSALKRKEISGIIISVNLYIKKGDSAELIKIADQNHNIRKQTQPSGVNNLGTTFNGGNVLSIKGKFFYLLETLVKILIRNRDSRKSFPIAVKLIGKQKFIPYIYYWNRYMFLDKESHILFPEYCNFVKSLYKDLTLEIEIMK